MTNASSTTQEVLAPCPPGDLVMCLAQYIPLDWQIVCDPWPSRPLPRVPHEVEVAMLPSSKLDLRAADLAAEVWEFRDQGARWAGLTISYPPSRNGIVAAFLNAVAVRWPSARFNPPQASGDTAGAKPEPKGRGVVIPDYRTALPEAYWRFVDRTGCRPTYEDLASELTVSIGTIKKRVRSLRAAGDPWPPPKPS